MAVELLTSSNLATACAELDAAEFVALDTEFHAERRYYPQLFLVQVNIPGHNTWIIDPLSGDLLSQIGPSLSRPTWLVHGGRHDIALLSSWCGTCSTTVIDTQIAAGFVQTHYPASLAALTQAHLDHSMEKLATLSDWSKRPLRNFQLLYAAEDVELLPALWERIQDKLIAQDRLALAYSACAAARTSALEKPCFDLAWTQIPARHTLQPQQAAILQELAAWREQRATDANQPPHSILSNAMLVDLAKRQPLTVESLKQNRRLPKAVVRNQGAALLEYISRAAKRPEWGWPQVIPKSSSLYQTGLWLDCLVRHHATQQNFSPRLMFPQHIKEKILLCFPANRGELSDHLGSFRDALIGDILWSGFIGQSGLFLQDGKTSIIQAKA